MEENVAPPLGDQLEDLRAFIGKLFRENEDLLRLPVGPPKCETLTKGAKYEYWEKPGVTVTPTKKAGIRRFWSNGQEIGGVRECPHCQSAVYSSLAISGEVVNCVHCGGTFLW